MKFEFCEVGFGCLCSAEGFVDLDADVIYRGLDELAKCRLDCLDDVS